MFTVNRRTAKVLRYFVKRYTQGRPVSAADAVGESIGIGTFYPLANQLLEAGWVRVVEENPYPDDRPMRTLYWLTPKGYAGVLAELKQYNQRPSLWKRIRGR